MISKIDIQNPHIEINGKHILTITLEDWRNMGFMPGPWVSNFGHSGLNVWVYRYCVDAFSKFSFDYTAIVSVRAGYDKNTQRTLGTYSREQFPKVCNHIYLATKFTNGELAADIHGEKGGKLDYALIWNTNI